MCDSGARMIPARYDKYVIVNILYVLIENESGIQITSRYPELGAVSDALSLAPITALPYYCMYRISYLSHIKIKTRHEKIT